MAHDRAADAAVARSEWRLLSLRLSFDALVVAEGADRTHLAPRSLRVADCRADIHERMMPSRGFALRPRIARPSTRRMFVSAKLVGLSNAKHATADAVYAPTPGSASRPATVRGRNAFARAIRCRSRARRVYPSPDHSRSTWPSGARESARSVGNRRRKRRYAGRT